MSNCTKESMLLYAVTDRAWLGNKTLAGDVEAAIEGGATFVQLREKSLNEEEFYKEAVEIQEICRKHGVPFVVNDNVEIAVKMNADGVHVGQGDMNAAEVRKLLGPDKIIGVTCKTVEQAKLAEAQGADYIGSGAMFVTSTKKDVAPMSFETLKSICDSVEIPVVAIGGISASNCMQLKGCGMDGIAVVSAIFAKEDCKAAAAELLELAKKIV